MRAPLLEPEDNIFLISLLKTTIKHNSGGDAVTTSLVQHVV